MPCTKCKADFNLLNWKLRCAECEETHCSKCLLKHDGCYFCNICVILIQRPPVRANLMELKPKDLQQYLNKHKVPTHGLVEKRELVDMFWRYQIPTEYKKSNRNKLLNLTGSVPNLAARSQCYINNIKSNAEAAIYQTTRNLFPTNGPQSAPFSTSASASPHGTPSRNRMDSENDQNTHSEPGTTNSKKYPQLSDFESEEQLSNLSVKELKELLQLNRVNYKGCVEKGELLQLAVTLWRNEFESKTNCDTLENCCKICMDAPLDCVLLECGHIATCIKCGKQLAECPICRQYITRVVRTFKV